MAAISEKAPEIVVCQDLHGERARGGGQKTLWRTGEKLGGMPHQAFSELAFIALKNSMQKDLNISFDLEVTAFSGQVTYIVLTHMGEVIESNLNFLGELLTSQLYLGQKETVPSPRLSSCSIVQ